MRRHPPLEANQSNKTRTQEQKGISELPRSTDTRPEVAAAIRTGVVVPLLTHLSSVVEPLSWRVRVQTLPSWPRVVDPGVVPAELDGAGDTDDNGSDTQLTSEEKKELAYQ